MNQALYILKSEISSLVTINGVWNLEGDEECFGEDLYCGISLYRDICYLTLYLRCWRGKTFCKGFIPPLHKEDNLG